mmetsp:Transcript_9267/g.26355  ORF Transcript_9267/g.26355 Transcript_9267/m.26355 type:complete len:209 (-) Transcript_9267:534-1160(-)
MSFSGCARCRTNGSTTNIGKHRAKLHCSFCFHLPVPVVVSASVLSSFCGISASKPADSMAKINSLAPVLPGSYLINAPPVTEFTTAEDTPFTCIRAFSTDAEQLEQVIPCTFNLVVLNCILASSVSVFRTSNTLASKPASEMTLTIASTDTWSHWNSTAACPVSTETAAITIPGSSRRRPSSEFAHSEQDIPETLMSTFTSFVLLERL